ncbi:MAG: type II toxin-antitoxin system RatA family toxin [Alphaproteobacteria bacterium]|jgi:coenzyme Q-binding protein COQ10|nr:type II toxin-antitoxin system RatA family toxin [Alphaproteobacteria bacterium]
MPRHAERRTLPYSLETMYAIVADVKRYPEFLPWVLEADIIKVTERGFLADLTVGYKLFQDTYRSEVILTPGERIEISYIKGPFKHLQNYWNFTPVSSNSVDVDFFIDFEFQSSLFQGMIQSVFTDAVQKMITAFEERAKVLSS